MSVLVSGASGFVGTALLRRLGPQARGLSLRSAETQWQRALHGVGCVVHLAARVHQKSENTPDALQSYRQTNTDLTLRFARIAAAAGVRRFVLMSSIKAMGESSAPGTPWTEGDAPQPVDAYGLSKLEAEKALQQCCSETGMEFVIVRPPLVYGPNVKANFASLIALVRTGLPLPFGAIRNQRSFIALDNLVDFIVLCTQHPQAANQLFLISDGDDVSTPELCRRIARAQQRKLRLLDVPVPLLRCLGRALGKNEVMERICSSLQLNIDKARGLLGWRAAVDMESALQQCVCNTRG